MHETGTGQQVAQLHERLMMMMMMMMVMMIHIVNERKPDNQTNKRKTYTKIKKQILYEYRPSEAWFPIYGLLAIEEIFH